MSKISKIILFQDDSFLFVVKRAPHKPIKDGKLELLGGTVDRGETPLQGLVRELVEEEGSSLVANKAAVLQLTPVNIAVEGDNHYIRHMAVTGKELEKSK